MSSEWAIARVGMERGGAKAMMCNGDAISLAFAPSHSSAFVIPDNKLSPCLVTLSSLNKVAPRSGLSNDGCVKGTICFASLPYATSAIFSNLIVVSRYTTMCCKAETRMRRKRGRGRGGGVHNAQSSRSPNPSKTGTTKTSDMDAQCRLALKKGWELERRSPMRTDSIDSPIKA